MKKGIVCLSFCLLAGIACSEPEASITQRQDVEFATFYTYELPAHIALDEDTRVDESTYSVCDLKGVSQDISLIKVVDVGELEVIDPCVTPGGVTHRKITGVVISSTQSSLEGETVVFWHHRPSGEDKLVSSHRLLLSHTEWQDNHYMNSFVYARPSEEGDENTTLLPPSAENLGEWMLIPCEQNEFSTEAFGRFVSLGSTEGELCDGEAK